MRNRIFRLLVCLVLVCVILVNCSPIRAEATSAGLTATYVAFAVVPEIAITAAVIALGVTGTAVVLGRVVSECEQFLIDAGHISSEAVDIYRADMDGRIRYMVSRELVQLIRDWLFDSGTIQETVTVNTSGFSSPFLGTTKDNYGPYKSVSLLADAYPTELTCIIRDLGIMNKVAVFDIGNTSSAYLIGLYWGADGRLMQGAFENPLGTANASLYGVYSYSDLNLVDCCISEFKNSSYSLSSGGIFYDKSYAEAMPDFQTSVYYAVDWTRDFSYGRANVTSSYCLSAKVFVKKASDSTWSSSLYSVYKDAAPDAYWSSCYISASDIVWDDATSTTFSVPEGLSVGEIAPQAQSFNDGYIEWASGAKSLPTLRNGEISDAESMYVSLGMADTLEDTMALTQTQAQTGAATGSNTGTGSGTASDAVTNTGLRGMLDSVVDGIVSGISSLFVPSAESMAAQQAKWTSLLLDRFGAVYDSVALIDNIAGAFTLGATQTQIRFPLITIPFGDVSWEFGGWMVDVVPDGFQVLVDALKVGIDILCTLAFVNAMKHRFDRVLEGRG